MSDQPGTPVPAPHQADTSESARVRPRVKKLRLLLILVPLSLLALVSTVFGMMMAVASDLPSLGALPQTERAKNSVLYDVQGNKLVTLTSNEGRIIVRSEDIAPYMKYAVIAVEDRRFYTNAGVDIRGIARAFVQDVVKRKAVQGGSTITQQFVKVGLKAQNKRTVFNKLRESAMAYHLTRKWSKERILTEYLNSIYFGNGAYGIESAARTYFGQEPDHVGCGESVERPCAKELFPHEAALLAGIIASPSLYDPVANYASAKRRRDLVLNKMVEEGRLTDQQRDEAIAEELPGDVRPPQVRYNGDAEGVPYFASWVRQTLVDKVGAQRAFEGGLRVQTTLDLELQKAAETAVNRYLSNPAGPTASVVAIDNATGEVRAMAAGRDYETAPFNLATQGQRQPGSAFKPFILAEALRQGFGPGSVWPSRKREFTVPNSGGKEKFVVNNFENKYSGQLSLAQALTFSDNSVFAAAGIKVGTKKVSRLARRMGIRTPVSTNYAMTLGGLAQGVTPLDMAHAFETFATRGNRIYGTLGAGQQGPVGIRRITTNDEKQRVVRENKVKRRRVLSPKIADLATQMLQGPVKFGTARRAQYGGFAAGKTGTTENSGDAWFVGFTDKFTVAVWVGYPDTLKPMETEFNGGPVEGGTFPALIWHDFIVAAKAIIDERIAADRRKRGLPPSGETTTVPAPVTPTTSTAPSTVPAEGEAPSTVPAEPVQPTPKPSPKPSPAPTPPAPTPPPEDADPGGATPEGGTEADPAP